LFKLCHKLPYHYSNNMLEDYYDDILFDLHRVTSNILTANFKIVKVLNSSEICIIYSIPLYDLLLGKRFRQLPQHCFEFDYIYIIYLKCLSYSKFNERSYDIINQFTFRYSLFVSPLCFVPHFQSTENRPPWINFIAVESAAVSNCVRHRYR